MATCTYKVVVVVREHAVGYGLYWLEYIILLAMVGLNFTLATEKTAGNLYDKQMDSQEHTHTTLLNTLSGIYMFILWDTQPGGLSIPSLNKVPVLSWMH